HARNVFVIAKGKIIAVRSGRKRRSYATRATNSTSRLACGRKVGNGFGKQRVPCGLRRLHRAGRAVQKGVPSLLRGIADKLTGGGRTCTGDGPSTSLEWSGHDVAGRRNGISRPANGAVGHDTAGASRGIGGDGALRHHIFRRARRVNIGT